MLLLVYTIGFVMPLVYQIYYIDSQSNQNISLMLCFITQILFFSIEVIQILEEKLDYFTSIWNIIDLTNFSIFMIYFFMRMFMQIDKYLPMHQMDIFQNNEHLELSH
jgi:hypothetical protein